MSHMGAIEHIRLESYSLMRDSDHSSVMAISNCMAAIEKGQCSREREQY